MTGEKRPRSPTMFKLNPICWMLNSVNVLVTKTKATIHKLLASHVSIAMAVDTNTTPTIFLAGEFLKEDLIFTHCTHCWS